MKSTRTILSVLTVTATLLAATLLHADPSRDQSQNERLAGTWLGAATPGVAPVLVSYMSDGRMILTRPITIPTGLASFDTVSTGHGEWIRTGNHEYAGTAYLLSSNSGTEFSVLVKLTHQMRLNRASDEMTITGTVAGVTPDGIPVFSFNINQVFKRVLVGE